MGKDTVPEQAPGDAPAQGLSPIQDKVKAFSEESGDEGCGPSDRSESDVGPGNGSEPNANDARPVSRRKGKWARFWRAFNSPPPTPRGDGEVQTGDGVASARIKKHGLSSFVAVAKVFSLRRRA